MVSLNPDDIFQETHDLLSEEKLREVCRTEVEKRIAKAEPCPFCGGKVFRMGYIGFSYLLWCNGCGASMDTTGIEIPNSQNEVEHGFKRDIALIDKWNNRGGGERR